MARRAARTGPRDRSAAAPAGDDSLAPRVGTDLVGQDEAETEVLRAWAGGRMSHAWLLTGPRGIGKATLAYRMARFILAYGLSAAETEGEAEEPAPAGLFGAEADPPSSGPAPESLALDPAHPVFRHVAAGSHPDLRVIERGFSDDKRTRRRTEIVVDDVRGIGAFLSLTPAAGGWRVVLIDAADEMNRNAANAVLKVLEEPPRRAVLLLVAHNPARLPATIPSRCRRLSLRPLSDEGMAELLVRHRPDLDEGARATLVTLSRGSIGRALDLSRQGGLDLHRDLLALLAQVPRMDIARCHALGETVARDDVAWALLRDLLPGWLARLTRFAALGAEDGDGDRDGQGGQGRKEGPSGSDHATLVRLSQAAPLDRWVAVWEKTCHLLSRTEAVNLDRKQAVLAALLLIERTAARA